METEVTCKKLEVTYGGEDSFLSGPRDKEIIIKQDSSIKITIKQCGVRTITLESDKEIALSKMNGLLTQLERLLMLFDGCFITLTRIKFSDSKVFTEAQLDNYAYHILNNRLSYFESSDFLKDKVNRLIEYDDVLTEKLFMKWKELLDELDSVNQMYLYSISNNSMPVDLKCAFLIELAEPLIEIVKEHKNYFTSLKPGERGTTLKICLDSLIAKFGEDIFGTELQHNYDLFLSIMVNSRNRIMHIKRNQNKKYFNGNESILYINKMSILYRCILFRMLDINENIYHDNLVNCISRWNNLNHTLENFVYKIQ